MDLSSLRPYEVTDFGETTIHGDDQAKNEESVILVECILFYMERS